MSDEQDEIQDEIGYRLKGNELGHRLLVYGTRAGLRARSAVPGRGFGPVEGVPRSKGGGASSAAIARDGSAVLGWTYFQEYETFDDDDDCCSRLAISEKRAGGKFGPRRTLTPRTEDTSYVDVTTNGDEVAVGVFGFNLWYGVFGRFGDLGGRRTITDAHCCAPDFSLDRDGVAHYVYPWYGESRDARGIEEFTRSRSGVIARPRILYRSRTIVANSEVGFDARGPAIALMQERTKKVYYAPVRVTAAVRGRDGTFGRSRVLRDTSSKTDRPPMLSLASARSGAAVATWSPRFGEGEEVHAAVRLRGRPLGKVMLIEPATGDRTLHNLVPAVNDSGRAVVAWRAAGPDGRSGIHAATARPGRPFSEPRLLSGDSDEPVVGYPEVVIDRAGRVTVAWQQGQAIRAAGYRP